MGKYLIFNGSLYEKIEDNIATIDVVNKKVEHDGCKNCKYTNTSIDEPPCNICKQSFPDCWEAGGIDG